MTTAHRPTWKAAVGRAQEGGWSAGGASSSMKSVLDAPAHTKLKLRAGPQVVDREKALRESLLKLEEVEKKQHSHLHNVRMIKREIDPKTETEGRMRLLKQTAEVDDVELRRKYDDADEDSGGGRNKNGASDDGGGWSDLDNINGEGSDLDASDSDEVSNADESDEDEEAALQAELAKIRAEREATKARAEAEAAAEEEARMEEAALMGNPLLSAVGSGGGAASGSGKLKRRWNDDVVFRNQARGEPDQNKKRFINDTVRNDFHKRFLNKFVR